MKDAKFKLAVLGIMALCCGCASAALPTAGYVPSDITVQQAPIHYKCGGCGAKIPRDPSRQKGFIDKCTRCGKKFIMM